MQFLVDLYRGLILLILALALIGGSWFGFVLAFGALATDSQKPVYLAVLIGAGVLIVLTLGITATFISIHDRIAEISRQIKRMADTAEQSQPSLGE